jgi:hypothetical protein
VQVAAWDNTDRIPLFDVPTAEAITGALHVCAYECFFSRWSDPQRAAQSSCLLVQPTQKESNSHSYCYGAGGEPGAGKERGRGSRHQAAATRRPLAAATPCSVRRWAQPLTLPSPHRPQASPRPGSRPGSEARAKGRPRPRPAPAQAPLPVPLEPCIVRQGRWRGLELCASCKRLPPAPRGAEAPRLESPPLRPCP